MELSPQIVRDAAERLSGVAHRTPVLRSSTLDRLTGASVHLKCENFQRVGAFKFRGAYNTVVQLGAVRGVVTHSSGNHAQGVALAARLAGLSATIVMPRDAPASKRQATLAYGARIVECEAEAREAVCQRLIDEEGLTLVHPYDDARIIAGQGTATLELLEEVPDLDLVVAPVGGGGLLSGACLAAALCGSRVRLVGVEPEGADDAGRSWRSGRIEVLPRAPTTLADGLRTRAIGEHNLAVMRRHVSEMVTVTDEEIVAAMRLLFSRLKLVVEPSGAVALAALLSGRVAAAGRRVGVLVSGGNVDLERLGEIFAADASRQRRPGGDGR
ncbi:MAG: pyridoxal-phosphate dependent enzyme [Deltaproteobacteria bacterium]|nr:MAG: pyridoxal-phosphate dependent enzyme [Deltaproteobacteria bacterium]